MTDAHVPLQELQLRLSSLAYDRGLCCWLYFGLENKISDRKTVKLLKFFLETRGFQFRAMEIRVSDKIRVS